MSRSPRLDDDDPDVFTLGGADVGSISQLDDKPCPPNPHKIPIGFDLTSYQKPKRRRRK